MLPFAFPFTREVFPCVPAQLLFQMFPGVFFFVSGGTLVVAGVTFSSTALSASNFYYVQGTLSLVELSSYYSARSLHACILLFHNRSPLL